MLHQAHDDEHNSSLSKKKKNITVQKISKGKHNDEHNNTKNI